MDLTPRQRILFDDLLSTFLNEGFESFTVDAAAKRFRCSKSTMYALGSNRDAIVRRIVISFFREVARRTDLAIQGANSPKAKLEAYFSAISTALEPASPAFMRDIANEPLTAEIYSVNTDSAISTILTLIHEGIAAGEFRTAEPVFLANLIAHMMDQIQAGIFQETISTGKAYQALGDLVLDGIRA